MGSLNRRRCGKLPELRLTRVSCYTHISSLSHPQGSRLILNLRAKHATNIVGPTSFSDLSFPFPTHTYSAVYLDDPEPMDFIDDEDSDTDREDAALYPSRANTMSSQPHSSRSNTVSSVRHSSRRSTMSSHRRSTPFTHIRHLSDVESMSPPSPLSPETRIPQ